MKQCWNFNSCVTWSFRNHYYSHQVLEQSYREQCLWWICGYFLSFQSLLKYSTGSQWHDMSARPEQAPWLQESLWSCGFALRPSVLPHFIPHHGDPHLRRVILYAAQPDWWAITTPKDGICAGIGCRCFGLCLPLHPPFFNLFKTYISTIDKSFEVVSKLGKSFKKVTLIVSNSLCTLDPYIASNNPLKAY